MQKISNFLSPILHRPFPQEGLKAFKTKVLNKEFANDLLKKVVHVALFVFKAVATSFFYWTNPSLFAIGFVAGIFLDEHVEKGVAKIKSIWQTQPLTATAIGTVGCILSLPVTLGAGTALWAASLGSNLSLEAQKFVKLNLQKPS